MNFYVDIDDQRYQWNNTVFVELSQPITHNGGTNAFHLPHPTFEPFRAGTFVGSIEEGGPCRCDVISFAPHGNGTHTECIGHVAGKAYSLVRCLRDMIVPAFVHTVELMQQPDGDLLVNGASIPDSVQGAAALVIRTTFNGEYAHPGKQWSGTNPAYFSIEAMNKVHELGVRHLLVDLPSVDREEDGGALAAHKVFWQWPHDPRPERTITELIIVPEETHDGLHLLQFNAAAFTGDAAPSRPVLYPVLKF